VVNKEDEVKRNIGSLIFIAVLALGTAGQTPGPPSCTEGSQAPAYGFWTWAARTQVKVYLLESNFRSEEIPSLLLALRRWNEVSDLTGSGVKLEYQGTTAGPLSCQNCLTIMRQPVHNTRTRHGAELSVYRMSDAHVTKYAELRIDPMVSSTKALTRVVGHELGHGFGLFDCYSCSNRSTIMSQGLTGPEGPTSCDIAQVREAYKYLNTRSRTDLSMPVVQIDEGEEPVDDDTPVVVPKP